VQSRFFHPKNGERIEGMREWVETHELDPTERSVALSMIMTATDRTDSTCGVQAAYLKKWAPRALNDLELRVPTFLPRSPLGACTSSQLTSHRAARQYSADVDLCYCDFPYNQHSYLGNYHVWETLCLWDKPDTSGIAKKRTDLKERKSPFNGKHTCEPYIRKTLRNVSSKNLMVSFSNEGFVNKEAMILAIEEEYGKVFEVVENVHPRYVGKRLGAATASNPEARVAEVKENNIEYFFLARKDD
jgi:adenine-specific DNA-methyltransferase